MSEDAGLLVLQRAAGRQGSALQKSPSPQRLGRYRCETALVWLWLSPDSELGNPPRFLHPLGRDGRGASWAMPGPKHPKKELETQLGFIAKTKTLPKN